jgi:PHD/YefM family antitoxin component YafN of YafNO toxin-antitoxin module
MLIVTRPHHEPVAILPLSKLKGLRETLHLLSSPATGNGCCAPSRNPMRGRGTSGRFSPDPRAQAAYR